MQLVGYESSPDAALLVADEGTVTRVALDPGTDLDYALGERHCAGVIQNGQHDTCSNTGAPWCQVHTDHWHEGLIEEREDEHVVYLAAFAPATFKVGITRTWRLDTRLREQGADCGAHIFTVPDGQVAREVESDVGSDIGERVRVATKIRGLHRLVDDDAWADLLDEFAVIDEFSFDYGLDLTDQPVPETLAAGTVVGVQGRVLVLEAGGTHYAVDLRSLVGYDVEPGGDEQPRQSSLGAF
ncbi:DUF2797 domain-containing protein [Halorarius litoreus]|uniref:DUF2797 domain-containing protein n=1 Tax=Halorarius litoreus TaxID=2962676 RepID=UPI0020CD0A13|nr:DUF2797 domain-containing protein [Halorarius litoreus]